MRFILRFLFVSLLLVATANAQSVQEKTQATISPVIPSTTKNKLDSIETIPVSKLQAVEKNGEIFFVSDNGRFVLQGKMVDAWSKKPLTSMADIKYATSHIDIDVMGLPLDKMNSITVPGGPKRIIMFVDPECSYCKDFLKDIGKYKEKYTFQIIVVPALGDKSNALAKSLFCAQDKSNAFDFLMGGKLGSMPQQPKCDTQYYDLTLTTAQLFGIKQIPFFVAPDGRFRPGAGPTFWQWVEESEL